MSGCVLLCVPMHVSLENVGVVEDRCSDLERRYQRDGAHAPVGQKECYWAVVGVCGGFDCSFRLCPFSAAAASSSTALGFGQSGDEVTVERLEVRFEDLQLDIVDQWKFFGRCLVLVELRCHIDLEIEESRCYPGGCVRRFVKNMVCDSLAGRWTRDISASLYTENDAWQRLVRYVLNPQPTHATGV